MSTKKRENFHKQHMAYQVRPTILGFPYVKEKFARGAMAAYHFPVVGVFGSSPDGRVFSI